MPDACIVQRRCGPARVVYPPGSQLHGCPVQTRLLPSCSVGSVGPWLSAAVAAGSIYVGASAPVMAIRFGLAASLLGSRNSKMPSLKLAVTCSWSIVAGSRKAR
jgi:hypothetical protein